MEGFDESVGGAGAMRAALADESHVDDDAAGITAPVSASRFF